MTENEAIKVLKEYDDCAGLMVHIDHYTCIEAIQALEEIPRYRDLGTVDELAEMQVQYHHLLHQAKDFEKIGTVERLLQLQHDYWYLNETCKEYSAIGTIEEFKALKEKSVAKKPIYVQYDANPKIGNWHCPNCNSIVFDTVNERVCLDCWQKLDWK